MPWYEIVLDRASKSPIVMASKYVLMGRVGWNDVIRDPGVDRNSAILEDVAAAQGDPGCVPWVGIFDSMAMLLHSVHPNTPEKFALYAGSSKHGNAFRAAVASNCDDTIVRATPSWLHDDE